MFQPAVTREIAAHLGVVDVAIYQVADVSTRRCLDDRQLWSEIIGREFREASVDMVLDGPGRVTVLGCLVLLRRATLAQDLVVTIGSIDEAHRLANQLRRALARCDQHLRLGGSAAHVAVGYFDLSTGTASGFFSFPDGFGSALCRLPSGCLQLNMPAISSRANKLLQRRGLLVSAKYKPERMESLQQQHCLNRTMDLTAHVWGTGNAFSMSYRQMTVKLDGSTRKCRKGWCRTRSGEPREPSQIMEDNVACTALCVLSLVDGSPAHWAIRMAEILHIDGLRTA